MIASAAILVVLALSSCGSSTNLFSNANLHYNYYVEFDSLGNHERFNIRDYIELRGDIMWMRAGDPIYLEFRGCTSTVCRWKTKAGGTEIKYYYKKRDFTAIDLNIRAENTKRRATANTLNQIAQLQQNQGPQRGRPAGGFNNPTHKPEILEERIAIFYIFKIEDFNEQNNEK